MADKPSHTTDKATTNTGPPPTKPNRRHRKRRDAGKKRLSKRDLFALRWIGHQYGIRLDHLQWLLGRYPGRGAKQQGWISESAARDVVTRWEEEGLVRVERLEVDSPFWLWLTDKGLRKVRLTYTYRDLRKLKDVKGEDLTHLYAINAIRLDLEGTEPDVSFTSERALRQGRVHIKGNVFLHRPDGVVVFADGETISIEAELSAKKPQELDEILLELLRGEAYLRDKVDFGPTTARNLSRRDRSSYDAIWYYAPKTIRKQVRQARARLFADDVISPEEAERIYVYWYPLAQTNEELEQQDEEDEGALDHV
jgi:hypothetical protein